MLAANTNGTDLDTNTPRRHIRRRNIKAFLANAAYVAAAATVTYLLLGAGAATGIAVVTTISLAYLRVLTGPRH